MFVGVPTTSQGVWKGLRVLSPSVDVSPTDSLGVSPCGRAEVSTENVRRQNKPIFVTPVNRDLKCQNFEDEERKKMLKELANNKPRIKKSGNKMKTSLAPISTEPVMTDKIEANQARLYKWRKEHGLLNKDETEQVVSDHGATEHGATEHGATEHGVAEHFVAEHDMTEQSVTEQVPTDQGEQIIVKKQVVSQDGASNSTDMPCLTKAEVSRTAEKTFFKCEQCNQTFHYLKCYNTHKVNGSCAPLFVCNSCNVTFKNSKCLKAHVRNVHEKVFKCAECVNVFPTEKTLNKHYIRCHIKHVCEFCKQVYKNGNVLRCHLSKCKVKKAALGQLEKKEHNTHNEDISDQQEVSEKDEVVNKSVDFNKDCSVCQKNY